MPTSSRVRYANARSPVISAMRKKRSLPIDCANSWIAEAK
jgi:hypothetical protein